MNTRKVFITLGLMLAFSVMLPVAHADELDEASQLTFNQSVQIPGRVLPAGTYWFVRGDAVSDRNIVRIFNSDRSTLYATVQTITAERLQPTNNTTITFAQRESMPANAILTWFYPGHDSGHEFVYSKTEERELARARHQTIMATAPIKAQTTASGD
jgi:hypothetical protein